MLDALSLLGKAILLATGLLAPGYALTRGLRLRPSLGLCTAGSCFALYFSVLVLQLGSVRISLLSLAAALASFSVAAIALAGWIGASASVATVATEPSSRYGPLTRMGRWTPLYAGFWALALWRAVHEPLAGADAEFRWSFLAEQMLRNGSLDFYPARSAADFHHYFWVESIPPGVGAIHGWAYACAGNMDAAWTIPAVVLQLWGIHELLWRAAERIGGERAAQLACMSAAACPLLTWSASLAQETGLTAFAMIGIIAALLEWRHRRETAWAALAGVFAVIGSSAREYGLVFPALAVTGLFAIRADRRAWAACAGIAAVSLVWPLRTFLLTGNPFYSLSLFGLPVNERFQAWLHFDGAGFGGDLKEPAGWLTILRYFTTYAPFACVGWSVLVTIAFRGRDSAALLLGLIVTLGLWVASVPYTNGGLFYSMRVSSAALVVGVLVSGVALASIKIPNARIAFAAAAAITVVVGATLPATCALPLNPFRITWRDWPAFSPPVRLVTGRNDQMVQTLLKAERVGTVATDAAGFQRRFQPAGVTVIPLWSPQVDWLFDRRLAREEAQRRWRSSGVTHVILSRWAVNYEFFNRLSGADQPGASFQFRSVGMTYLAAAFRIEPAP